MRLEIPHADEGVERGGRDEAVGRDREGDDAEGVAWVGGSELSFIGEFEGRGQG